uniref:DNA polymerase n=1 Tax=Kwoniella pini CBS 10737 TaxID=1296096 RepID=A0A1B9I360_9TREE|nr:DNA polymerase mu subunit [Kwoniella pini CBS 10737]OCF49935.1 DNA polymerase mu subunit [Kwoniella pini CBS 10737]
MPHRPPAHPLPSASSSSLHTPHSIAPTLYQLFANMTFHIISAKLETEIAKIYECIDELGGKCVGIEECNFVISAIKGKPRLVRSLGEWMNKKPIFTPEYIFDTYTSALEYAANPDPSQPPKLPKRSEYIVHPGPVPIKPIRPINGYARFIESDEEYDEELKPASKKRRLSIKQEDGVAEKVKVEDMTLLPDDIKLVDIPALCIHRGSPLICVNQDMIDAIRPILEEREFEEAQQKNSNVLSYRRSLSVSAVPYPIRSGKEAMKLNGVGEKVAQRIDEYLQKGFIADSVKILNSSRYQSLKLFATVYSIGHHTSKELYDRHHCRTLEDVRMHFEAIEEESPEARLKDKLRRRRRGGMKQVEIVEEWIKLKDELDQKISRKEVEEIAECVMEHLEAYIPDCDYTICGGYRRGKTESNDVDIVFRPPGMDQDIGLLRDLYLRLSDLGIITHVLHVTHREMNVPIHASPANFDNLDKAFVILKLPGPGRLHRRVDLISSPNDRYASAVLSWSGSMMFERDLKRYAENVRRYKFRAGLIEMSTGDEINLETEREIFEFLGLKYVPPEMRNAD